MLHCPHLTDEIGVFAKSGLGVPPREDHAGARRPCLESLHDGGFRQVTVPQGDVDLVQHHQVVVAAFEHRAALVECRLRNGRVAIEVLGIPGEPLAHGPPVDPVFESREKLAFPRFPLALDELHHAHALPPSERTDDDTEGRTRLALAIPRVHQHQTATRGRCRRHPLAVGGLLDLHLFGVLLSVSHGSISRPGLRRHPAAQ